MKSQRLGMLSLRLDALYCLVLGSLVALTAPATESAVPLPLPLIVAVGAAVVLWAGLVEWMRAKLPQPVALRIVLTANIAATVLVGALAVAAVPVLAVLVILTVAVDIALFAGSQAIALTRLRTAA
ncbi:hypothetical protein OG912_23215 [Streptomyces sp. NBC_00464]|uniref:hypothetical protein n=1 Tax=Streptomyces sp. NBC_00464 TaxID=2975751 RepID=UPI002E19606B